MFWCLHLIRFLMQGIKMMICTNCGNKKEFSRMHYFSERGSEIAVIDGETEETIEYTDNVVDDFQITNQYPITCDKCSSEDVEVELEETDIARCEWEHTNKDGTWSPDELDETERNEEKGKEYLAKSI